jgi:hypothetical protein
MIEQGWLQYRWKIEGWYFRRMKGFLPGLINFVDQKFEYFPASLFPGSYFETGAEFVYGLMVQAVDV